MQYVVIAALSRWWEFHEFQSFPCGLPELLDHKLSLILRIGRLGLFGSLLHVLVVLRVHESVGNGPLDQCLLFNLLQKLRMALGLRILELLVHSQISKVLRELLGPLRLDEVAAFLRLHGTDLLRCLGQVLVVILGDECLRSFDVDLQLVQEIGSYFKVGAPRVHELQRLQERPLEFLHEVQNGHDRRSALASHRMDQHARPLVNGFVDESHDLLGHPILLIEDQLPIVIQPVECQKLEAV